jgi:hypothetical protein
MENPSVAPKGAGSTARAPLTKAVDQPKDSRDAGLDSRLEKAATVSYDAKTSRPVNRRIAARRLASRVPSITGLRLSPYGGEASLVNISVSGALIRCSTRVLPGTALVVVFEGTFSPSSIKSRVARCLVADIDARGVLWYHVGVGFDNPITLEDAPVAATEPASAAPEAPRVLTPLRNRW